MIVELVVNCLSCDEEIVHRSLHVDDKKIARVNVDEFAQTDWVCPSCGKTTSIGDVDAIDPDEDYDEIDEEEMSHE